MDIMPDMPTPRRKDWTCPPAHREPRVADMPSLAARAKAGHRRRICPLRSAKTGHVPDGARVSFLRSCCFPLTKPQIQR